MNDIVAYGENIAKFIALEPRKKDEFIKDLLYIFSSFSYGGENMAEFIALEPKKKRKEEFIKDL